MGANTAISLRALCAATVVITTIFLAGCGQKGPLTLPADTASDPKCEKAPCKQ